MTDITQKTSIAERMRIAFFEFGEANVGPFPHHHIVDRENEIVLVSFNNELRAKQWAWRLRAAASGVGRVVEALTKGFSEYEGGDPTTPVVKKEKE